MSLYLKYRPKTFTDLIGQDHVKITIQNALEKNNLAHAYIFSGPRGTGKTSTARLLAISLACETEEMRQQAVNGNFIDIIEIDAASNRGIDEMRDLREKIQLAPILSKFKIYIIDEVHMLTKEAFNSLLKTLEEPPSHVYFILATTEIHKVPETILSRCQRFAFKKIQIVDIMARLKFICEQEEIKFQEEALEIIANKAEGGMRDAIATLEKVSVLNEVNVTNVEQNLGIVSTAVVDQFANELIEGKVKEALNLVQNLIYEGYSIKQFEKELIENLRDKMLAAVMNDKATERILEVIEVIQKTKQELKFTIIPHLVLEIICIKLGKSSGEMLADKESGFFKNIGWKSEKKVKEKDQKEKTEESSKILEKNQETELIHKAESPNYQDFNLPKVKQSWDVIVEKIITPTVKAAVKSVQIEKIEGKDLHLTVSTDFYYETLKNAKGQSELTAVIKDIFGEDISLHISKMENVQLSPTPMTPKEEKPSENIVDIANEVFGKS